MNTCRIFSYQISTIIQSRIYKDWKAGDAVIPKWFETSTKSGTASHKIRTITSSVRLGCVVLLALTCITPFAMATYKLAVSSGDNFQYLPLQECLFDIKARPDPFDMAILQKKPLSSGKRQQEASMHSVFRRLISIKLTTHFRTKWRSTFLGLVQACEDFCIWRFSTNFNHRQVYTWNIPQIRTFGPVTPVPSSYMNPKSICEHISQQRWEGVKRRMQCNYPCGTTNVWSCISMLVRRISLVSHRFPTT